MNILDVITTICYFVFLSQEIDIYRIKMSNTNKMASFLRKILSYSMYIQNLMNILLFFKNDLLQSHS